MSFIQHGTPLFVLSMNKRNDISPNRRLLASLGPATNKAWIAASVGGAYFVFTA
jgi:hypothetical protein